MGMGRAGALLRAPANPADLLAGVCPASKGRHITVHAQPRLARPRRRAGAPGKLRATQAGRRYPEGRMSIPCLAPARPLPMRHGAALGLAPSAPKPAAGIRMDRDRGGLVPRRRSASYRRRPDGATGSLTQRCGRGSAWDAAAAWLERFAFGTEPDTAVACCFQRRFTRPGARVAPAVCSRPAAVAARVGGNCLRGAQAGGVQAKLQPPSASGRKAWSGGVVAIRRY